MARKTSRHAVLSGGGCAGHFHSNAHSARNSGRNDLRRSTTCTAQSRCRPTYSSSSVPCGRAASTICLAGPAGGKECKTAGQGATGCRKLDYAEHCVNMRCGAMLCVTVAWCADYCLRNSFLSVSRRPLKAPPSTTLTIMIVVGPSLRRCIVSPPAFIIGNIFHAVKKARDTRHDAGRI